MLGELGRDAVTSASRPPTHGRNKLASAGAQL